MTAVPETTATELPRRRLVLIFGAIALATLPAVVEGTVVATAVPSIVGDLGGVEQIPWVITAYLLTQTIATPLFGKLGDLYGRKRLYELSIIAFVVACVMAGASQSMMQLIVARAIQGVAAGGLIVLGQAMIGDVVSARERGRWMGFFGAIYGVGSIAGPWIGGALTDHLSWRWIFFVNIPLCALSLLAIRVVVPSSPRRADVHVDWVGTALLSGAITALVLLTTWGGTEHAWSSPVIVGLAIVTVAFTIGFVLAERRAPEPLIPLALFRNRTVMLSSSIACIVGAVMFVTVAYLPTFLQISNGASATNAGMLLVPQLLGTMGASVVAGQIVSRTGHYRFVPVVGTATMAVGMYLLAQLSADSSHTQAVVAMVVVGIGVGFAMTVLIVAAQNATPPEHLGVATSTVSFFRSVGGSLGVALFGALFVSRVMDMLGPAGLDITPESVEALPASQQQFTETTYADAITQVFALTIPLLVLAFVLAWCMREVPLHTMSTQARMKHEIELEFAEDAAIAYADPALVPDIPDDLRRNSQDGP